MSHFPVLVVTDTPNSEAVSSALAPFHEYECTGRDDEYVTHVDFTDEARQLFITATMTLVIQRPDGSRFNAFNNGNWCDELKPFLRPGELVRDELHLPQGWIEIRDDLASNYLSLTEWTAEYYGIDAVITHESEIPNASFILTDEGRNLIQACNYTNPNAKWDWWVIGGRWHGMLKLKHGKTGTVGSPAYRMDECGPEYADQARKGDIDFHGMMKAAENEAAKTYDAVHEIISGLAIKTWDEVRNMQGDLDLARSEYHSQPAKRRLQEHPDYRYLNLDKFAQSRASYIEHQKLAAVTTFAVLIDCEWLERGNMGWFAVITNEDEDWDTVFQEILSSIPDDKFLTVVDCHI